MNPIPLPAPYGGINDQVPEVALRSPFCKNALNFNTTQEGMTLRHGDSQFALKDTGATCFAFRICAYGNSKLLAIVGKSGANTIEIYDVEAGTLLFTSAALGFAEEFWPVFFNGYLFLFNHGSYSPGFYYDGTTVGSIGYTGSGFESSGGNVYKNRGYYLQYKEAAYWYTGIDAVTGALTKVDLSGVISNQSYLAAIGSVTIADNVSAEILQAFIFFSGEVLFYSGAYPDSSDWRLQGTAQIALPLNFQSILSYNGDTLVFCDTGIISLRDLFLKGSEKAKNLSLCAPIQATWTRLIKEYRDAIGSGSGELVTVRAVWDQSNSRILIQFPFRLDSNGDLVVGGTFYFVFDTLRQSWLFHQGSISRQDILFYKGAVYCLTKDASNYYQIVEKEGAEGYVDLSEQGNSEITYPYDIVSAPITAGAQFVQRCEGLDVIINTDLFAETYYYLRSDLGVTVQGPQATSGADGVLQRPFVNMGIEGSYIQWRLYGNTTSSSTAGLSLYGVNVWLEQGNVPR